MGVGGAREAWVPSGVGRLEVTRAQRALEVGYTLGEAGTPGREGGHCREEGKPEGVGGTGLGTPAQQDQEGALSGVETSCGLCSCKTCPMIYVLLGVSDCAFGVLIDVKTCEGEGGGQSQSHGSLHSHPGNYFQKVLEVLSFVLEAEVPSLRVVAIRTPVVLALHDLWRAKESDRQ